MLYAIALLTTTSGQLRAFAPDLDQCDLTGRTAQELLPRLRLAIEAELTRLLLAGEPLPDPRDGSPPKGSRLAGADTGALRWLTVHINLVHLEALARHQAGRPTDGPPGS